MKIVFFGSSRYVIPVLDMLNREHSLLLVVTTELNNQEPVRHYCNPHKISCISVRKAQELLANYEIQREKADIGIVADFGIIIQQQVLNYYPNGIVNVHPSLLPKYRGPTPAQSAILNGDAVTGVSIIQLDKLIDHGPVLAQKAQPIEPRDTAKSLYEKLFKEGAVLLSEVLQTLEHSNVTAIPQDETKATLTKFLTREDGYFDYKASLNPTNLNNMIRAYYPWPGAWTRVKINLQQGERIVKFLPDLKVQVEGGKEMGHIDFINGYPNAEKLFLDFLGKDF